MQLHLFTYFVVANIDGSNMNVQNIISIVVAQALEVERYTNTLFPKLVINTVVNLVTWPQYYSIG